MPQESETLAALFDFNLNFSACFEFRISCFEFPAAIPALANTHQALLSLRSSQHPNLSLHL